MKRRKNKVKVKRARSRKYLTLIVGIVLALSSFFLLRPLMTGYVVISEERSYVDTIEQEFDASSNFTWFLDHKGELLSVRASGLIIGNGSATIYLKHGNTSYKLLDSTELKERAKSFITGLVVGVNETIDDSNISEVIPELNQNQTAEQEVFIDTEAEQMNLSPEKLNITLDITNITEIANMTKPSNITEIVNTTEAINVSDIPFEKKIILNLSYNYGTNYDPENDGVESKDGVIDFTVKDTLFSWDAIPDNLCTKWEVYSEENKESTVVCYGALQCCNFIELQPSSAQWNDSFYIYSGRWGATEQNIISAQVIYVDYSIDADKPTAEIYSSELSELPAAFIEQISFTEACSETCILYGLNDSSYELVIEVEPGTVVLLNNISYKVRVDRIIDLTPPDSVVNVTVYVNRSGLLVSWDIPPDADFAGVRILRKIGSYPFANYSLAILDNSTDDISYLMEPDKTFVLDRSLKEGNVYFYRIYAYDINMNYASGAGAFKRYVNLSINHPPELIEDIPNITLFQNTKKVLDLKEYFEDADANNISFSYYQTDGVSLSINGSLVTIIPQQGFIGIRYTYFVANDSEFIAVSNLVPLHVLDYGLGYQDNMPISQVEINKPVTWIKTLTVNNSESEELKKIIEFNLPMFATLISVYVVNDDKLLYPDAIFHTVNETNVSAAHVKPTHNSTLFFEDIFPAETVKSYLIQYETLAPLAEERYISDTIKQIAVSSEVSYENILAHTTLPKEALSSSIWLFHITEDSREIVKDITYRDANNNSLIDTIEWIIPHLSTRVYEVQVGSLDIKNIESENDTWLVQFKIMGVNNLTITGENTSFGELLNDNKETYDDIQIMKLQCEDLVLFGNTTLDNPNLFFILEDDSIVSASYLADNSIRIKGLLYSNYSCESNGYITFHLLQQRKHSLVFEYGDERKAISYSFSTKIPAVDLFFKDSCPPCYYNKTRVREFCPRTNAWHGYMNEGYPSYASYAEIIFNISSFSYPVDFAEICAYKYTMMSPYAPLINYAQEINLIARSYADSDVIVANLSAYAHIPQSENWPCIPVTGIVNKMLSLGRPSALIRWLGEDENQSIGNFACYRGIANSLPECEGYNPSGASDCRPYMNILT
jgi:hypothetical protein